MDKHRIGISFTDQTMHILDKNKKTNENRSECCNRLLAYAQQKLIEESRNKSKKDNQGNPIDTILAQKLVKIMKDHHSICHLGINYEAETTEEAMRFKELKQNA